MPKYLTDTVYPHAIACGCGAPGTIHDPCILPNCKEILDSSTNHPGFPDGSETLPSDDDICLHSWADRCECWIPITFNDATSKRSLQVALGDMVEYLVDGVDPIPLRVIGLEWEKWRFSDKPKLRIVAAGYGHERSWSLHPDQPDGWPKILSPEPDNSGSM